MYVLSDYRSGVTPDIGPLAGPVLEVQGGRQRGEQTEPQLVGEAGDVSNYGPQSSTLDSWGEENLCQVTKSLLIFLELVISN